MQSFDKIAVWFRRAGHRLRCFCDWLALFPRCVLDWNTDSPDCDKFYFEGVDVDER